MTLPVVLIAAVGRNRAIGRGDRLPWRLPGDLRHFRAMTMGKPLILGRKTWQSIGRPLPGRTLVVVSADARLSVPPEVELCRSPEDALARAQHLGERRQADAVVVAGGATIYQALIGRAARLEITEVDLEPEADVFFPPIDVSAWREVGRVHRVAGPGDDADYALVSYARRQAA